MSIIKFSVISNKKLIDTTQITKIIGVTSGHLKTLGTIKTSLLPNHNTRLPLEFKVVPDSFPIPVNGILGKDFIKMYNCILDYLKFTLSIRVGNSLITVPIHDESMTNGYHLVPPRCEKLLNVRLITQGTHDQVIQKQEIFSGVFIASAIVNPNNCVIRVLNTNCRSVEIRKVFRIQTDNVSCFHLIRCDGNVDTNRTDRLMDIIKFPPHSPKSLSNLCREYAYIFAVPGDKHSVCNFHTQSLRLVDESPVYLKNYRHPYSQKEKIKNQVNNMLQQGFIEPSCTNYNSPLLLVPKKSVIRYQRVKSSFVA